MSRRRRSRSGKLPPGFEGGLYETGTFAPSDTTYPNGCHVCEVEIDPDTGEVEIVSYVVVDDVGTVVNPIGLKGQIHGGVAQGLGQAVMERVVYDREVGPDAERQLHGLRDAARRRHAVHEGREQPVPDRAQPARREGRGRSRHGRRAAGGRQRGARRAGAARGHADRHADDPGPGVAGDTGGAGRTRLIGRPDFGRARISVFIRAKVSAAGVPERDQRDRADDDAVPGEDAETVPG